MSSHDKACPSAYTAMTRSPTACCGPADATIAARGAGPSAAARRGPGLSIYPCRSFFRTMSRERTPVSPASWQPPTALLATANPRDTPPRLLEARSVHYLG